MNKHFKRWQMASCWFCHLIFIGLLVTGCASTKKSEAVNPPAPAEFDKRKIADSQGDRFAVGDLVSLSFSGAKGFIPSHQEHIKNDGTITLPFIGAMKADGKTPGELLKEIHDHYVPHYYKRLVVNLDGGQNVYYVEGQVRSSGRQVFLGASTTMMMAMQFTGGFTDRAAEDRVQMIRASGEEIEVNLLKPSTLGLQVFPGDRIIVPKRSSWDVYPLLRYERTPED